MKRLLRKLVDFDTPGPQGPAGSTQNIEEVLTTGNDAAGLDIVNLGTLEINNTISQYNGDTTAGNGLSSIVANEVQLAQSSDISTTSIFTPNSDGMYVINYYVGILTPGGIGATTMKVKFTYTDYNNNTQEVDTDTISVLTTTIDKRTPYHPITIFCKGGNPISYATEAATINGVFDIFITIERKS